MECIYGSTIINGTKYCDFGGPNVKMANIILILLIFAIIAITIKTSFYIYNKRKGKQNGK